jgi:hypothetical protein
MSISYFKCAGCGRQMNDAMDDFEQCLVCDRAWCLSCGKEVGVRQCQECGDDFCEDCEGEEGTCSNCSEPEPQPAMVTPARKPRSRPAVRKGKGRSPAAVDGRVLEAIRQELKKVHGELAALSRRVAKLEKRKPPRP